MHPVLDKIKTGFYNEFGLVESPSTLSEDLKQLKSSDTYNQKIIEILINSIETEKALKEILDLKNKIIFGEYDKWILEIILDKKSNLENELESDREIDRSNVEEISEAIVDIKKPNIEFKNNLHSPDKSAGEYRSDEVLALEKNVKNYIGGRLAFEPTQSGFVVNNIGEDGIKTEIINRKNNVFASLASKMLDENYVNQCAEIIAKSSSLDSLFNIKIPSSMPEIHHQRYVTLLKAALVNAGVKPSNIVEPSFANSLTLNKEISEEQVTNTAKTRGLDESFGGSILKERFLKYLDTSRSKNNKNPWINFKALCDGESKRLIDDMIANNKGWISVAKTSDKIFAINQFIQEMKEKSPDNYYGIIAVKGKGGKICFKPDTNPFVMEHVYDAKITENQIYRISSFSSSSEIIDLNIERLEDNIKSNRATASKHFDKVYKDEQSIASNSNEAPEVSSETKAPKVTEDQNYAGNTLVEEPDMHHQDDDSYYDYLASIVEGMDDEQINNELYNFQELEELPEVAPDVVGNSSQTTKASPKEGVIAKSSSKKNTLGF